MIATTIRTIPEVPAADADAGFGALATKRGNLPLTSLDVTLSTTGLACRTEMVQGFTNSYDEPLEATYIFPLPDRAAVTSLRLEGADRVVEGVLRERGQAREEYDRAVARGQRAAIAEEERPGVFTMRVGNILPGENVKVRLTLASQLPFEDGVATLRFPLVVAPRYIPGSPIGGAGVGSGVQSDTDEVPDASRITPPVMLPGFGVPVQLSITADIDPAGLPLDDVASSLHAASVEELGGGRLRVRVHPGERADRDFILRMRLGAEETVTHSVSIISDSAIARDQNGIDTAIDVRALGDVGAGTFVLTVLPPRRSLPARPRDVVLVLDRSGSMDGWKMVAARRAAARIVDTLTARDRFAVLAFDNTVETPEQQRDALNEANDRNRFHAIEFLSRLEARGGTEVLEPLETAARFLAERGSRAGSLPEERERALVLVTDGQVGNEDEILRRLPPKLGNARIQAVGIDTAVNAGFLQRLAGATGGRCELVESEDALDRAMDAIHRRIGTPLITDLRVAAEGLAVIEETLTPAPLPALYEGAPLVITGRFRGAPAGAVAVHGMLKSGQAWRATLDASTASTDLAPVWARSRLRDLEDAYASGDGRESPRLDELERKIIATSLRFGVLCRFTAFAAIDTRVVNEAGIVRRVTQPVELPAGWSRDVIDGVCEPAPMYPARGPFVQMISPSMLYDGDIQADLSEPASMSLADAARTEPMSRFAETRIRPKRAPDRPSLFDAVRKRIDDCLAELRAASLQRWLHHLAELQRWLEEALRSSASEFNDAELHELRELTARIGSLVSELHSLESQLAARQQRVVELLEGFSSTNTAPQPRRSSFWRRHV